MNTIEITELFECHWQLSNQFLDTYLQWHRTVYTRCDCICLIVVLANVTIIMENAMSNHTNDPPYARRQWVDCQQTFVCQFSSACYHLSVNVAVVRCNTGTCLFNPR
jgi:hypothetical protein